MQSAFVILFLASLGLGAALPVVKVGVLNVRIYQVIMIVGFLFYVLPNIVVNRKLKWTHLSHGQMLSLVLFMSICFLSAGWAVYPILALKQIMLLTLQMAGAYFLSIMVDSERRLEIAVWTVRLTALIVGVYVAVIALMTYIETANPFATWFSIVGPFTERNEYGIFLIYSLGFFLPVFCLATPKRYELAVLMLALTFLFILLVVNYSRGSYAGFFIQVFVLLYAMLFWGFRISRKSKFAFGLFTAVFVGLSIGFAVVLEQLGILEFFLERLDASNVGDVSQASFQERYLRWFDAINIILDHPITGVGLGNMPFYFRGYYLFPSILLGLAYSETPIFLNNTLSNFIVETALETGLIGLAAFVTFLYLIMKSFVDHLKLSSRRMKAAMLASLLSMIGLLINGLSYNMIVLPFFWTTVGIGMATVNVISRTQAAASSDAKDRSITKGPGEYS